MTQACFPHCPAPRSSLLSAGWLVVLFLVLGMSLSPQRAWAAPIFSSASVTPDIIAPNGDGNNEFAEIRYTVSVDTAQVRVVLEPLAGGAPVDTLLKFTRQGAGVHSVVFDGTGAKGAIPDGDYRVRIDGIGTQGQGQEAVTLPLSIDRVAPVFTQLSLLNPPTGVVRNGDTVTIRACFTLRPDSLFADFSSIDGNFSPERVVIAEVDASCVTISYTVSADNPLTDVSGRNLLIIASDRAGNTRIGTLPVCLSNHPPAVISAELINVSPVFQNGDKIVARYAFDSPNVLSVAAAFDNLDSGFQSSGVVIVPEGNQVFRIEYNITNGNTRADGDYLLRVTARDGGCGTVTDASLTVTIDNQGNVSSLITDVGLNRPAFSPGKNTVTIQYTVLETGTAVAVFGQVLRKGSSNPEIVTIQSPRNETQGVKTTVWDGRVPGIPDSLIVDQVVPLIVRAISVASDQQRNVELEVTLDRLPPRLLVAINNPDQPVRNGEAATFSFRFDGSGYTVIPDFSELDTNFIPGTSVVEVVEDPPQTYAVSYVLSATNQAEEGLNRMVSVLAEDLAGNVSLTPDAVALCYTRESPRFESSRLVDNQGPFKNGDRIIVETVWTGLGTFSLTGDFSAIDTGFQPANVLVSLIDTQGSTYTYRVQYTISADNLLTDVPNQPIYVTATDDPTLGCGVRTALVARVTTDATRPDRPTFDTPPDQVVGTPTTVVTGRAPGSARVEITVNQVAVDTVAVTLPDSTFSAEIALRVGQNDIRAFGIDAAGNKSVAAGPLTLYRSEGATIQVPQRFKPNSEFFISLVDPARSVTIHILDLEGTEVQKLEAGSGDLYRIPWDGLDFRGLIASSGPMFAVIQIYPAGDGGVSTTRKPFVFTRR